MQTVRVTPVVGLPQFTGWSQVVDTVISPGIHLVTALAVSGDNAGSLGREVVSILLEKKSDSPDALYQLFAYLQQYVHSQQCELSLVGGIFNCDRCILASSNGSVILRRGSKTGTVLPADAALAVVEGTVRPDDVFILLTRSASAFYSAIEQQFERGYDVDGVITGIVPAVHGAADSSQVAVGFITTDRVSQVVPQTLKSSAEAISNDPSDPVTLQEETQEKFSPDIDTLSKWSNITSFFHSVATAVRIVPKIFSSKTYVGVTMSKKRGLLLLFSVLSILASICGVVYVHFQKQAATKAAAQRIEPYRQRMQTVEALAETDILAGREAVDAVVADLMELRNTEESLTPQDEVAVAELLLQAQALQEVLSGTDEVSQLPIYYDLRLAVANFVASYATAHESRAVFIDDETKQSISLDLDTKNVLVQSLSSLSTIAAVAAQGTEDIVVLGDGVHRLPLREGSELIELKPLGDSNRDGTHIATFGRYIYVFNPEKRNIYRYAETEESYSDPIGWLQDPLGVEFSSVTSLQIDGDLWIGTSDGTILKFTSGRVSEFTITGLPVQFDSPLLLFTSEDTTNLYILEAAKKRLVILTKEGMFVREVTSHSLAASTALIVQEAAQKAFIVNGSLLYEVAL